jgi:putative dimethyl sulfoxide reductase chaperone
MNELQRTLSISPRTRSCAILARVACFRSQMYRWLAVGFFPPDEALVASLESGVMLDELQGATLWLGDDRARLAEGLDDLERLEPVTLEGLQADYERYFGKSVDRVPARESAYRWRDVSDVVGAAGDVARTLRQQYRQFGTAAAPGSEDHVAVELEFMAYLCAREAAAWAAETPEAARQLRRQQHNFLDDHLGRWLPDFCGQLDRRWDRSFYVCFARLCNSWMQIEHGPGYVAGSR